jgi:aminoglycoside phosphotransferase (APT) family kinase protein
MLRVAIDPLLSRVLVAAGLDDAGNFTASPGWVNRVWVSDALVVRFSDGELRGGFLHEARVVGLLTGTAVPHARCIGTGTSPDGTWYISERLPGRTLHQVWNELTPTDRREVITALGAAIRVLHEVEVPIDLRPPWFSEALTFEPRSGFDARMEAALWLAELAELLPGMDRGLIKSAHSWLSERRELFAGDARVLVHADLHPSNVMVDGTKISGLIDFEVARAQPADAELHRLLFWCARPQAVPPVPGEPGLDVLTLRDVPGWLRDAYPQPFAAPNLRERLLIYEMQMGTRTAAPHADPRCDGRRAGRNSYSAQRPRVDRPSSLVSQDPRRRPDRRVSGDGASSYEPRGGPKRAPGRWWAEPSQPT